MKRFEACGKGGDRVAKKSLKENMSRLLLENVSEAERELLKELGFTVKKPNKYTVIAAALYKKAASGDLSAIKELRALVGEAAADAAGFSVVRIVDDIGH